MWKEIAAIYRQSKKAKDINRFTEWVCRPPAAALVYFFEKTKITPNQVTFLSFFICAGASAMYILLPGHLWLILATLTLEFSFILDCVDGQLARIRKTSSHVGHLLDFLIDEIKAMMLIAAISVRLWDVHDQDELYLLVGLIGLFSLAAGIALTSFMRRPEYLEEVSPGAPIQGEGSVPKKRSPIGLLVFAVEYVARIIVHYPSCIWLAAAFNRIDIFFWAYAGVATLYFVRSFLQIGFSLGRFAPTASSEIEKGTVEVSE